TPDAPSDCVVNSRQAARTCALDACDPRFPYRVIGDTVKFITFECDQRGSVFTGCSTGGTDLDGDDPPDASELVIQSLDVNGRSTTVLGTLAETPNPANPTKDPLTDSASIYPTTGLCIETLATTCSSEADCGSGEFCASGVCKRNHRTCMTDDDCPPSVP